jgi:hypothetical protein
MNEMASKEIPLKWDVFVAKRQGLTRDLPPRQGAVELGRGVRDSSRSDQRRHRPSGHR